MARTKQRIRDPFQTIDLAQLDTVSGGRVIPRSGMDPKLGQGIASLAQAISAVGQQMAAQKQAGAQQMMQMMQQMMQMRGGGGPPKR
jgi:hypothetical protein